MSIRSTVPTSRTVTEELLTHMVQQLVGSEKTAPSPPELNLAAHNITSLVDAVHQLVSSVTDEQHREVTIVYRNLDTLLAQHHLDRRAADTFALLISGAAHAQSARLAAERGMHPAFDRAAAMDQVESQRRQAYRVPFEGTPPHVVLALQRYWDDALERGYRHGLHHARITLVEADAPVSVQTVVTPSVQQTMPSIMKPIMHTTITTKETPVIKHAPRRRRLSDERRSITHKFVIGSHQGYITVGLYDDGTPGEVFVKMAKEGSVISGMMDAFATSVSIGLQYGVPLQVLVNKFVNTRFEPSGPTNNAAIKVAKSIVDYIFRWLAMKFLSAEAQLAVGINVTEDAKPGIMSAPSAEVQPTMFAGGNDTAKAREQEPAAPTVYPPSNGNTDPACGTCGSITVRHGEGHKCLNCGAVALS